MEIMYVVTMVSTATNSNWHQVFGIYKRKEEAERQASYILKHYTKKHPEIKREMEITMAFNIDFSNYENEE